MRDAASGNGDVVSRAVEKSSKVSFGHKSHGLDDRPSSPYENLYIPEYDIPF